MKPLKDVNIKLHNLELNQLKHSDFFLITYIYVVFTLMLIPYSCHWCDKTRNTGNLNDAVIAYAA